MPPVEPLRLVVDAAAAGERLDRYLTTQLEGWSRVRVQQAIRAGLIQVDGRPVARPREPVSAGSAIQIDAAPPAPQRLAPADIPLEILYADDDLAAINKPAGLLVHPGAGQQEGTLVHALLHHFSTLSSGASATGRPGIVHRLDRFSSGVMVVARNDWAHQRLAAQFQARVPRKHYVALVHGQMKEAAGEIAAPIHRDRFHRVRMTTRRRDGRAAQTRYKVRETLPPSTPSALYCLLDVDIMTGRTHQIRVHLASLGHPVVGDRLYGAAATLAAPSAVAGYRPGRVMLHAAALTLEHPRTGQPLEFRAPLPPEFESLLTALRQPHKAVMGAI